MEPGIRGLDALTRRQVLRGAAGGGVMLSAGGLLVACGGGDDGGGGGGGTPATSQSSGDAELKTGGILRVGATGGGPEDSIDAHRPTTDPDIMRGLEHVRVARGPHAGLRGAGDAARRVDRGEQDAGGVGHPAQADGVKFHNGKPVTADDVIFSLRRIVDPKDPKVGAASIGYIDRKASRSWTTSRSRPAAVANAVFADEFGQYFNGIVPTDYDPENPVGTGPFKSDTFTPGEQQPLPEEPGLLGARQAVRRRARSSSTSPTPRRASTRCSAARSTRSQRCPARRSSIVRATRASRSSSPRPAHGSRSPCASTPRRSTTCACARRCA